MRGRCDVYDTTEEAAEKGMLAGERSKKHLSGAKAHVESIAFAARDPEGAPVMPCYKTFEE
jgi:hypothetical protein